MNSQVWHLELLGRPCLRRGHGDGAAAPVPLIDKDAAWLAYLALEGPAPSRTVAALVWPQREEKAALNNLRQRVHKLRKLTGARLVEMADLLSLAGDLRWDEPAASGAQAQALPLLAPFEYEDCTELAAWLQRRRGDRAAAARAALEAEAAAAEDRADFGAALLLARRLLAADPLSEAAHRRLMRLHYLNGDTASAVQAFDTCEQALRSELGVHPSVETLQLLALAERGQRAGAPRASRQLPAGLLRPPVTIGHDAAAAQLSQVLAGGGTALLVGEAGVGKSRLLGDLVSRAGAALVVQARPGDQATPFALARRVLAALQAQLPDSAPEREDAAVRLLVQGGNAAAPTPGASHASALGLATQRLLQATTQRGLKVLAVDDLHFADPASIEWLGEQTASARGGGMHWVLATRPAAAQDAGAEALAALGDAEGVVTIDVKPLAAPDVGAFVDSLGLTDAVPAALRSQLYAHTGGNPLYLLETLRALLLEPRDAAAGLPAPLGVEQLIRKRLARLSKPALALARVAALAVPDFSVELAAHVLQASPLALADAWAELETAQVLRGEAFAHDLVQDAARQITPEPVARHTHRQIAEFLAQAGGEAARLGAHWQRAGLPDRASAAYERAAAEADGKGRLREAAQLLREAAEQAQAAGAGERASRLAARCVGRVIQSAGPDATEPDLVWMERHADTAERQGLALVARAMVLLWQGANAQAEAVATQAQALPLSNALGCSAARMRAMSLSQRRRTAEALAVLGPWMPQVDSIEDVEERVSCLVDYTSLLMQTERLAETSLAADRTLQATAALANNQARATALINRCVCSVYQGDLEGGLRAAAEADQLLAADEQSRTLRSMNQFQLGWLLGAMGRYRDALPLVEGASESLQRDSVPWVTSIARNAQASLYRHLGQPARALNLLAQEPQGMLPAAAIARLQLLAELKDPATAEGRAHLDAAMGLALQGNMRGPRISTSLLLLPLLPVQDQLAQAPELERLAADTGYGWMHAQLRLVHLEALVHAGRLQEVADAVASVAQDVQAYRGQTSYHPQILLRAAQVAQASGCEALARDLLRLGIEWVHAAELHVPDAFLDSFRHRNRTNVALRAAWRRAAEGAPPAASSFPFKPQA